MASKYRYIVTFYSRNTGNKLALPVMKFMKEGEAIDYADYVCSGRPDVRMAKIHDSKFDYTRKLYYNATEDDILYERARYLKRESKSGKQYFVDENPVPYLGVSGHYRQYKGRSTYGPLAPLNPAKKKKTTKKRK